MKKNNSFSFLSLKDYANELFFPITTLNRGLSTSQELKNIQEVYLPNVDHKQVSIVLNALIAEEKRQRVYINNSLKSIPSSEKIPLNFNESLFKKKIEKLNVLVNKYNKLVKLPFSSKREENQKKLFNKFWILIYGNKRSMYFPNITAKVIKETEVKSLNLSALKLV